VTYIRDLILRMLTSPSSGFVIALVAFGIFGAVESLNQRNERQRLLILYLSASVFFAILGSAAAGAAVNHFLEPALALSALAPAGLARLRGNWEQDSPWPTFAVVLVVLLLLPSLDMQRWAAMHERPNDLKSIVRLIGNRTVFTDMPYIGARSSAPQFLDPASLTYASRTGGWSGTELVKQLEQRQYEFVILSELPSQPYDPAARYPRYPHLGLDIRTAIVHNYHLCLEVDKTYFYTPANFDKNTTDLSCVLINRVMRPPVLPAAQSPSH
jgi:hypothetical protein